MTGVSITVDDAALRGALRDLQARLSDLSHPMASIGQTLVTETDLAFRGQRDPWGNAWTKLRDSTLRRRRGKSAHILRDTGRLANSINYHATRDSVTVGTDVIYAATHQFGRPDNRFYNTPKGRPAPIPSRPFLPIRNGRVDLPQDTLQSILGVLERHLMRSRR